MLSYARQIDDMASWIFSSDTPCCCKTLNLRYSHNTVTRNAWVGDSDLQNYKTYFQSVLYSHLFNTVPDPI